MEKQILTDELFYLCFKCSYISEKKCQTNVVSLVAEQEKTPKKVTFSSSGFHQRKILKGGKDGSVLFRHTIMVFFVLVNTSSCVKIIGLITTKGVGRLFRLAKNLHLIHFLCVCFK